MSDRKSTSELHLERLAADIKDIDSGQQELADRFNHFLFDESEHTKTKDKEEPAHISELLFLRKDNKNRRPTDRKQWSPNTLSYSKQSTQNLKANVGPIRVAHLDEILPLRITKFHTFELDQTKKHKIVKIPIEITITKDDYLAGIRLSTSSQRSKDLKFPIPTGQHLPNIVESRISRRHFFSNKNLPWLLFAVIIITIALIISKLLL